MTPRIVGLIVVELLLVVGGLWVVDARPIAVTPPSVGWFAVFVAILVVLNLLPSIYLEHRRHNVLITPADGAIIVGLFILGPAGFVVAAMAAELVISVRLRQPALKLVFNLVSMLGGYTAAAAAFAAIGRSDPLDPLAWAAGLVAMAACALWDVCSTAALFSIVERRRFREMVNGLGPALFLSLLLSAALGLVALVLLHETPIGAVLVVPVLAILVVSTRSVTQAQAERNRLERLYEASKDLTRLVRRSEALAAIATGGRGLVTGAAAVSATEAPDGTWEGVVLDDAGARPLEASELARLLEVTGGRAHGAAECDEGAFQLATEDLRSVVWAVGEAEPAVRVLLAVLFEHRADERAEHRVDVLATFVAHAATVLANVELHDDVREALAHEVALNQQKSEFVAAVSHELRTPLAGMIGALQTVQHSRERMTEEQLAEVLEVGNGQGARLLGLIEDLLLVAAAEHEAVRIEPREVDAGELLRRVVVECRSVAGDRLVARPSEVHAVWSDRDKVHRILSNLVDNARKYAPTGPIELGVEQLDDAVRFTVDDEGPGIDPADRERIFERFVQLDQSSTRRQGGIGLGLHLSRELAGLLGGQLTVTDAPGGGARFCLTLPGGPRAQELERSRAGTSPDGFSAHRRMSPGIIGSPLRRPPTLARPNDPTRTDPDLDLVDPVPTLAGGPS